MIISNYLSRVFQITWLYIGLNYQIYSFSVCEICIEGSKYRVNKIYDHTVRIRAYTQNLV